MHDKRVWDENDVHSLKDLLRDPKLAEAMFGRVFTILGIKGEELNKEHQQWKARAVFQGSNVRTKTGTSAAELFEEVANAFSLMDQTELPLVVTLHQSTGS